MQRRVRNVSSLVMGRLVRAAAIEQANKGATYFCKSSKERQLQQLLNKRALRVASGDFADYFDRLYTARCG